MILLSHPTGNSVSRALLAGMLEEARLAFFATSVAVSRATAEFCCLPAALRSELSRRVFNVPASRRWTRPWREIARLSASRFRAGALVTGEHAPLAWERVYQDVDAMVAGRLPAAARDHRVDTVYAYEDAALGTFASAQRLGLRKVYDLPIAYWETSQRLLGEERDRLPAWACTMMGTEDSTAKLERKRAELELADIVMCPSRFVFDSLPAWCHQGRRCEIVEFGSPPPGPPRVWNSGAAARPLRVLFAGSLTQRKGLADVFAAMRLLNRQDVELIVFGSPIAPLEFYRQQYAPFTYEAPRPNAEVLRLMESCDVLALPSLVEGRAVVQQEAMSRGLPLIITRNTGGEDLVEEGKTGFLVPIRDPEAIAAKISWCADHREELAAMGERARLRALEYTWAGYARRVLQAISDPS